MSHPFLSIDLETTGTDDRRDQILQIGAVAYGGSGDPVEFVTDVWHGRYEGSAFALSMNADILRRIADNKAPGLTSAITNLEAFIYSNCVDKPVAVGFAVGWFDLAFLKRDFKVCGVPWCISRRSIDLAALLAHDDGTPMGSSEATRGLFGADQHDALLDARNAAHLHRTWITNRPDESHPR